MPTLRSVARIVIIGTGYVGLTSGACFASLGHDVMCVDIVEAKIKKLQSGRIPIVESGLQDLVAEGVASGRLSFSTSAEDAVTDCEIVFLCVPTPEGADGSADLSYIQAAARALAPVLPPGSIVVNKSTVPVGSTKVVENELSRSDVIVVSNPEFLREGTAIQDFLKPDRIVVGSDDQDAALRVAELYEGVGAPVLVTDPASAETIKYAANAFLATKISYINAIAAICEGVGADIRDVVLGLGYDRRIGNEFLKPGPGWGGSCFPKDTKALVRIAEDAGYDFGLLRGVIAVNEQQFGRVVSKIRKAVGGSLRQKTIGIWGLSFKAGTDDLRDSPAIEICRQLSEEGADLRAFDPTADPGQPELSGIHVVATPLEAAAGADVLAVLTEWDEFRLVDPREVVQVISGRRVVDARNHLDRSQWRVAGFYYQGIGR